MNGRLSRVAKPVLVALTAVMALVAGGFGLYVSDYYRASDSLATLEQALEREDAGSVAYAENDVRIAVGSPSSGYGLVFYPGAKVEARAYVPLAVKLANRGVYCVIAKMPFNLAFFGVDAADGLMAEAPDVATWWVGGHSLGGAMAAQFAAGHTDKLSGVALLGAYSASDLSATGLSALVVYGSEDGVLNREKLAANEANLPQSAVTEVIEGGNHAGFGEYGMQDGDGAASISADEQQERTADLIVEVMARK